MNIRDPKVVILGFRDEILVELGEAQKAIPPLQAVADAAAAAADEATTFYRALQQLLGKATSATDFLGVTQHQYLEGPIGLRANNYSTEVDEAKSRRARALADVQLARAKVTSLKRAIAQIDLMIPPAAETEEAA